MSATPSRLVLPKTVDPEKTRCFVVTVPDEPYHIAAFKGAIFRLAKAYTWQNDTAHTAKAVAAVWMKIFDTLQECATMFPVEVGGAGGDDEIMIRQNPDNPCELQSSADGTNWCTFADFSKCFNFGTQGGPGAPQPPTGGGEQQYCNALSASGLLLLPTLVNTGDVITLSASGAGWDGAEFDFGPLWRCPDGEQFIAGACVGFTTLDGGDPVPTSPHMCLLYLIGSTYYEATPTFTVPGGVINQQVQIQVNDISLTNNQGSYQICATVQNNGLGTFTHVFDFSPSPSGWIAHSDPSISAQWLNASGWIPLATGNLSSVNIERPSFSGRTFTGFTIKFRDSGGGASDSGLVVKDTFSGTNWHLFSPLVSSGSPQILTFVGNFTAAHLFIELEDVDTTDLVIEQVTVTGNGTDPF